MTLAVVTGASGHIGNNLVRLLLEHGYRVRVLVHRNTAPIEALPVETTVGDLLDTESLSRAFEGAGYVFHLAGFVSILESDAAAMERINIEGTKNVLEACRSARVERLVYASSIEALLQPGGPSPVDERVEPKPEGPWSAYSRTKYMATRMVFEAASEGLDAVVVYPTAVVGPGDYRPSLLGQTAIDFAAGKIPCFVEGSFDFVDVRDVAAGMIAAAERGRSAQGYILGGERLTTRELARVLEEATGIEAPRMFLPNRLSMLLAWFAARYYTLTGKTARFTPQSIRMLADGRTVLHRKAHDELGYTPRRPEQAFREAVTWFDEKGMLTRVFRSRRDALPVAGAVLFLLLCIGSGIWGLFEAAGSDRLYALGALLVGIAYLATNWPVSYRAGKEELLVRSGLLRFRIPWKDITEVRHSRVPISAPGWSFRRIKICWQNKGKTNSILISPWPLDSFMKLCTIKRNDQRKSTQGPHPEQGD
ncbi:MAG: NAD-dependent epimerase/dehydratase family protein [Deltaproteobacteria bacterium]|nr:MAG: NAD-dependent epimerase/dehydratase family protein [Deltaproteobacteria bacterium]